MLIFDLFKDKFELGEGLIKASFEAILIRVLRLLLLLLLLFLISMFFLLVMFVLVLFLLYVRLMISKELKLLKFKAKNSCLDVLSMS